MPIQIDEIRPYLHSFDFTGLFVEGLGWNNYSTGPLNIAVKDRSYTLKPIAEKANFVVFECDSSADTNVPEYPVRRKIESEVAKRAYEHLIIYVEPERRGQIWQWVKRESGKPAAFREYTFPAGQTDLLQRLREVAFSLDEEARGIGIADVTSRVRAALDVEKVTKRFYDRFRTELCAFGGFVDGITAQGDRDWYASLMLNRMMFIYFVQKQGFLDGDADYLRNRLRMVKSESGGGRFQQFYRIFLLRLFHEGLGQREADRAPDLAALLGRVPFLNGGLFDQHDLERDNPGISIPDEAFERVFEFFDGYRWHLDERPGQADNEINPDVLGYIFEKYINQKQMGAYYTKEDITGYISRNTIIPFLFGAAKKECPVAFRPGGGVWHLLQDNPDRYIYPAVGHGVTWNARQAEDPQHLEVPHELPADIAAGIGDVAQRGGWNRPAPDEYALPTETWREVVARRQRHAEVRSKLAAGEVQDINDLITLNLDVEQFAMDVIVQSEGSELLRAFWHALHGTEGVNRRPGVSVLDPTCGSGAFLFAALNVLEPLYSACLEGMRGFVDDLDHIERPHSPNIYSDFKTVLERMRMHPSERYFILKSIVLDNLYGVDIMEEAVEICKLRLFLKLVSQLQTYKQIEPLPDIDFNIRAGNTLVGFTSLDALRQAMAVTPQGQYRALDEEQQKALQRIEEEADIASRAFDRFREQQTAQGEEVTAKDKKDLRDRLRRLDSILDRHLASEYGVDHANTAAYEAWRASHQPFHWFIEFYGVMSKGGFDVVIGNPPYVEYSKVRQTYTVRGYKTESCDNLYAYVMERCKTLANKRASLSMIVPLSGHSTQRMQPLVSNFYEYYSSCHLFNISADAHPSVLFNGVKFRLAIFVASNHGKGIFTTGYFRYYAEQREYLFSLLDYTDIGDMRYQSAIPKVSGRLHLQVLRKMLNAKQHVRDALVHTSQTRQTVLYHSTPVNWIRTHSTPPYFRSDRDGEKAPNGLNALTPIHEAARSVQSILCSTSFFIWWLSLSDCYHLNRPEVLMFPLCQSDVLGALSTNLEADMQANSKRRVYNYKTTGRVEYDEFYLKQSKPIVDEIDHVLAEHYGFTDEELDFIINYDIKYRMGREG